jgi:hypothetical protein
VRGRALVPARSDARISGWSAVGRRFAYRVFLPAGDWSIGVESRGDAVLRARMGAESLSRRGTGEFGWRGSTSGWQLLELSAPDTVEIRHVTFKGSNPARGD